MPSPDDRADQTPTPVAKRTYTRRLAEPELPWLNLRGAARRIGRSPRFVLNAIKNGKLRAAQIGGRKEIITRVDWLDQFIEAQATPIPFTSTQRRSA